MQPIVIAEAGVNHNGSFDLALRLIDAAADAGADYVKFQTFKAANLVTQAAAAADYQQRNCSAGSQFEMLKALELSYAQFEQLCRYCKSRGIGFLSTPFDLESIDFLASLGIDYLKVPSGEITNLPYLRAVAATKIPAIISTGMSTIPEIEEALDVFFAKGYDSQNLTLLHCTTEYPAPLHDVNLLAMPGMARKFGIPAGYSDHTQGIDIPVAACALGASVIEKHFTLDRNLPGPDHKASLTPGELSAMVAAIRNVAVALGSPHKTVTPSEMKNRDVARKSIVAALPIEAGEIFSEENLTTKRPGSGISPMKWDSVIGMPSPRRFLPDEPIDL